MLAHEEARRRHAINNSIDNVPQCTTSQQHHDETAFAGRRRNSFFLFLLALLLFAIVYRSVDPREIEVQSTVSTTTRSVRRHGHDAMHKQPLGTASHKQQQQQHCVIHVHGFHHSGTGVLRQAIYKSLGENVASIHRQTRKQEDEGQHIQRVYPKFFQRRKFCLERTRFLCKTLLLS